MTYALPTFAIELFKYINMLLKMRIHCHFSKSYINYEMHQMPLSEHSQHASVAWLQRTALRHIITHPPVFHNLFLIGTL